MPTNATQSFGDLLKQLRKRVGMTQRDLAAALNYSDSLISGLEKGLRKPDLHTVITQFIPALGLQDDHTLTSLLIERAAAARGVRPPAFPIQKDGTHIETLKTLDSHRDQMWSPFDELIGRAAQVQQLSNRLLGHTGRLLTLVGPPGMGKTRLAQAIAENIQHHYPDGAVFVPLASVSDPLLMATTIALIVKGDDTERGEDTSAALPIKKLIALLHHRELLLVLDNCEQIDGAGALVAELMKACPGIHVLATSRERLHLRIEQRYQVPPLDLASAVDLFIHRAVAVNADFVATADNHSTIEAICRRLDCLPLALELCAAQADLLAPTQILAHLYECSLDLLVDGALDLPPQHRTLRHAIQHSYDLLADDERVLLRRLNVFTGGWSLDSMVAVCGWQPKIDRTRLLSTLYALIGKSLVRTEMTPSGDHRFFMLETIREFAREQARVCGEEELLRKSHYSAYLQIFRTADSHFRGPESAAWFTRCEPEQDNLRAALQWALDAQHYTEAAWLILASSWFWLLCGQNYESARWLQRLLPHRYGLNQDLRLAVMLWFYAFAHQLKDFQPVDSSRNEIRQLLERCSHPVLRAAAWHWIAETTPDITQAEAASEQCIAQAREAMSAPELDSAFGLLADRHFILAANLENHAKRLIERGEFARATTLMTESLIYFQAQGHQNEIAQCIGVLGRLALLQGDIQQAQKHLREALQLGAFKPFAGACTWQVLLGIVTLYIGDSIEARRLLSESLHFCLDLKNTVLLARACTYLAETSLWECDFEQAKQWLMQSLAHHADPRWITVDQIDRLFIAARLLTAQCDYLQATKLFGLIDQVSSNVHYMPAEPVHSLINEALATERVALSPDAFATAFAAGQQLSLAEAYATILHPATMFIGNTISTLDS